MSRVVETAAFRVRDEVTEERLVEASAEFQRQFLDRQPGFIRRELLKLSDRDYVDLVHWRSGADAAAVLERATASAACQRYFSVMDPDFADVGAGVTHYTSLAVYPASAEEQVLA